MGKNKKTKNSATSSIVATTVESRPVYIPTPGITDGKADDNIAIAFHAVGKALANGEEGSNEDWALLVPGMKEYYRRRYKVFI